MRQPGRRAARQRSQLEDPAFDDHAYAVGERGRILEVMGNEQRRQPQLRQQFSEFAPDDAAGVRVECGERLVEEEDCRVARERPRECDTLPLATRELAGAGAGEMRDPKALQQVVDSLSASEGNVATHVEVREERVLLEDEPNRAALRRKVDPGRGVKPNLRTEGDAAMLGPKQPRNRAAARSTSPPPTGRRARASSARARGLARGGRSGEGGRGGG